MLLYLFISLGSVSLGGLGIIGWRQLAYVRTQALELESHSEIHLKDLLQRKVDSFYHNFSLFFRRLIHYSYLYSLLGLRRLIVIFRFILARIEKKFSRLIDSVHGRGVVLKSESPASDFISKIKEHKDAALAQR